MAAVSVNGSVSGEVLTVTDITSGGPIAAGASIAGASIPAGSLIVRQISGAPGGLGIYLLQLPPAAPTVQPGAAKHEGFVQRLIDATFVLGEGDFGLHGQNTVKLSGLRISARVSNAGGASKVLSETRIYGMTLSQMNALTTLGMVVTAQRKNSITLAAGTTGNAMAQFFQGTIYNAWGEFRNAPNVPFHVMAQTGLFEAVKPATQAISIRGSADVAEMLFGLSQQMNMRFENNGITAKLANSYYGGSAFQQAQEIVKHAGIEWNACENGILAIWKPGASRGSEIPLIAPNSGLASYPTYTANGIALRTRYNPSVAFGGKIRVQSSLKAASATWVVYKLDHELDAQVPSGQWHSSILAAPPGLGPFVP